MQHFFAPGKLLLSGEYSVLQGAKAVAVPTKAGQHLEVRAIDDRDIQYRAFDHQGAVWLNFKLSEAQRPEELLVRDIIQELLPPDKITATLLESRLDFPREWGLGSSSTFISLIAQWAQADVWPLFFKYLKGSGYDVAVAEARTSLSYQLQEPQKPRWERVKIPAFFKDTALVYRGQKQNSAREVERFLSCSHPRELVAEISKLSEDLLKLNDVQSLEDWMDEHEHKTAQLIGRSPLSAGLLPAFPGSAKSLGAWGGDFIWLSRYEGTQALQKAGYGESYRFSELIHF